MLMLIGASHAIPWQMPNTMQLIFCGNTNSLMFTWFPLDQEDFSSIRMMDFASKAIATCTRLIAMMFK